MNGFHTDKPHVLLVDDEPANLQLLRTILSEEYRLSFARSADEALELVAQEAPDLILLDVVMPQRSGYYVCRQLKANPATSAIPVIFVSALTEAADQRTGFSMGAVGYLTKPINPALVREQVRDHLRQHA
ncbi:MAG: two-component system response regulator [Moraxellaceae bacterium]|jgi:putative two-component system response regulator|nr:two-component system response regulator [Moraxellaceae bacterium]